MWNVIVDFLYLEIARIVFEINIEKKRNDEEKMREIWTVSSAGWLWFECRERDMRKKVKDAETRDHSHGSPSQRFRGHIFINVFFLSPPRLFFLWRIKRFHTCWLFVFFRIRPKFPSNWDSIHRLFSLTHFQHENETLAKLMDVLVKGQVNERIAFFFSLSFSPEEGCALIYK